MYAYTSTCMLVKKLCVTTQDLFISIHTKFLRTMASTLSLYICTYVWHSPIAFDENFPLGGALILIVYQVSV
jgi:hypothetical protein